MPRATRLDYVPTRRARASGARTAIESTSTAVRAESAGRSTERAALRKERHIEATECVGGFDERARCQAEKAAVSTRWTRGSTDCACRKSEWTSRKSEWTSRKTEWTSRKTEWTFGSS
jgi:hypothetical protein